MPALYRKIRPRTFGAIIGQRAIVRTLINQLKTRQVSHAYLFCGTRGTGKTSAAKIFARAINCTSSSSDGEPCNTCEMCENILAERSLDVAEIDAASNNGVDNIRDLREEVKFLPTQGAYKVYIIDEVHMLSGGAFNALLKTLEEPPPHVIFILATTDPQKIPATILSRCQRFDFRRISAADMTGALADYLRGENLPFEDAALDYIAYHSDGAMRDAISLLDQCLSDGSGGGLTLDKVREILGAVDRSRLFAFADALSTGDANAIMKIIADAMGDGRDVSQFAADLVRHFRDVLVAGLAGIDEFSADIAAKLAEQASRISRDSLMRYIEAFSELLREMRFAPHMRTAFEICALKLCAGVAERVEVAVAVAPVASVAAPVAASVAKSAAESAALPLPHGEAAREANDHPAPTPEATPPAPKAAPPTPEAAPPTPKAAPPAPKAAPPRPEAAPPTPKTTPPTPEAAPPAAESAALPLPHGEAAREANDHPALTPKAAPPTPKAAPPSDFAASWPKFCAKLPANIRSFCAPCGAEEVNGMLKIYCGNETAKKIIESKQSIIRENLAEFFKLSTPPNLAVEVNEAYNKPQTVPQKDEPPEQPPMDWDNFGQEVIGDEGW